MRSRVYDAPRSWGRCLGMLLLLKTTAGNAIGLRDLLD